MGVHALAQQAAHAISNTSATHEGNQPISRFRQSPTMSMTAGFGHETMGGSRSIRDVSLAVHDLVDDLDPLPAVLFVNRGLSGQRAGTVS